MKRVRHYSAGPGTLQAGRSAACGAFSHDYPEEFTLATGLRDTVTCRGCQRTKQFKQAPKGSTVAKEQARLVLEALFVLGFMDDIEGLEESRYEDFIDEVLVMVERVEMP